MDVAVGLALRSCGTAIFWRENLVCLIRSACYNSCTGNAPPHSTRCLKRCLRVCGERDCRMPSIDLRVARSSMCSLQQAIPVPCFVCVTVLSRLVELRLFGSFDRGVCAYLPGSRGLGLLLYLTHSLTHSLYTNSIELVKYLSIFILKFPHITFEQLIFQVEISPQYIPHCIQLSVRLPW